MAVDNGGSWEREALDGCQDNLNVIIETLKKAKRYSRVTGTDERTEITMVFQENDWEPLRQLLLVE